TRVPTPGTFSHQAESVHPGGANLMSMTAGSNRTLNADPNVTPLIDVLLVLLIIFMVIVPVTPRGLRAVLPQQPSQAHPHPTRTIVVEILASPSGPAYRINQQNIADKAALGAELNRIYSIRAEKVLFIQGDPKLDFAAIAEVLDLGRALAIDHIGILTPHLRAG
ncbi:MAG TPA: biopolymer transporter ExbD, partial [Acidobacteriaceae bacterium]|nr:biopolymer transporter ExbD [Acidobacteriaceae bacterium]